MRKVLCYNKAENNQTLPNVLAQISKICQIAAKQGPASEVAAIAPGDRLAAPGDEVVTVQRVVETRFAADQVADGIREIKLNKKFNR